MRRTLKAVPASVSLRQTPPNPFGYGRILRDSVGRVTGIVEEKDASEAQRKIHEINTGIYCVEMPLLFTLLENLSNDNAQGEYYLTDDLGRMPETGPR